MYFIQKRTMILIFIAIIFIPFSCYAELSVGDRVALEAYEEKVAEIDSRKIEEITVGYDNAALLYYQAFLMLPDVNEAMQTKIEEVYVGGEPDRQIRIFLGRCLPAIEIFEIASRIPRCKWSEPSNTSPPRNLYDFNLIISVYARTLATDGHYRAALEQCLNLRRLSRHISEGLKGSISYYLAVRHNSSALRAIQYILGIMPTDADILTRLRGQLAVVQGPRMSLADTIQAEVNHFLERFQTNSELRNYVKNRLIRYADDEEAREFASNLTDEQILLHAREIYEPYLDSIFRILDSEMTYEQKSSQIETATESLKETYSDDRIFYYIVSSGMGIPQSMLDHYTFHVENEAHINGIKAAVEIYLIMADTGRLPEQLPDYLPKDPFNGDDFVYEITDEGFALRCQGGSFLSNKKRFLEFKVQKQNN